MQQRGYSRNVNTINRVCLVLVTLTVVLMSISKPARGLQRNQRNLIRCHKGENSNCNQSQYCGPLFYVYPWLKDGEQGRDETIQERACLCCRLLNSSARDVSQLEECDLSYVVDLNGNCNYNESAYNGTMRPPVATKWREDTISRGQTDTPTWIISLPCVGGGLLLLGSLIYLVWYGQHKGYRLCRKVPCVDDPEKDSSSSSRYNLGEYQMPGQKDKSAGQGCPNLVYTKECSSEHKYQTEAFLFDEHKLHDTFKFLFPSKLPQIDGETNTNDGNENASLHQLSRKALFKSSLEKSALMAVLMSDANWATFNGFCARLDIGQTTDMLWKNVAGDLGYTVSDIQWIVKSRDGSSSLTCIQDFLGRTHMSESEAAFCLLHQSVAKTKNTAALKELESVQIVLGNRPATTMGCLVSGDLDCSAAFHKKKEVRVNVKLQEVSDCNGVSALVQSMETSESQYGTCV